jgi:hypothetical protein
MFCNLPAPICIWYYQSRQGCFATLQGPSPKLRSPNLDNEKSLDNVNVYCWYYLSGETCLLIPVSGIEICQRSKYQSFILKSFLWFWLLAIGIIIETQLTVSCLVNDDRTSPGSFSTRGSSTAGTHHPCVKNPAYVYILFVKSCDKIVRPHYLISVTMTKNLTGDIFTWSNCGSWEIVWPGSQS